MPTNNTPTPLVEELPEGLSAVAAFERLCHLPHVLFLDSARRDENLGRYSFVAADPSEFHVATDSSKPAWGWLRRRAGELCFRAVEGLPPFQGGAAGLFGYSLSRHIEKLPATRFDEFGMPNLALGLYDVVAAFDHVSRRAWLISHGWGAPVESRASHAAARARKFQELLRPGTTGQRRWRTDSARPVDAAVLAPQFELGEHPGVTSNFSREGYLAAVQRAVDYIWAGDCFQVNLSQRLLHPARDEPVSLYLRLRERNAAPFAGYFDLGEFQVASASPERFLQVRAGEVEARPIKGTRRRIDRPEADLFAGDDLQASAKDRAENVMIVDLMRNDLSRVCESDSVRVTQLCGLETYAFIQHLVSSVRGRLRPGCDLVDLVLAAFPGGSVTGAPKVRAMEIIAELEPTARGAYCGSLGYIGFDGSLDLNILIRTITAGRGWWQFPVGGGIVAQSDPAAEYAETLDKAAGLLKTVGS
jgi:para-aminobenzoate synthetase component 1